MFDIPSSIVYMINIIDAVLTINDFRRAETFTGTPQRLFPTSVAESNIETHRSVVSN